MREAPTRCGFRLRLTRLVVAGVVASAMVAVLPPLVGAAAKQLVDINPDVSDNPSANATTGGRANGLANVPGEPNTYYAASEFRVFTRRSTAERAGSTSTATCRRQPGRGRRSRQQRQRIRDLAVRRAGGRQRVGDHGQQGWGVPLGLTRRRPPRPPQTHVCSAGPSRTRSASRSSPTRPRTSSSAPTAGWRSATTPARPGIS